MSCLVLPLLIGVICAGEPAQAMQAPVDLRTIGTAAGNAGDFWTLALCEAHLQRQRQPRLLAGRLGVHGDPSGALPAPPRRMWERPNLWVAWCQRRLRTFTRDGLPAAPAPAFPFDTNAAGVAPDAGAIAAAGMATQRDGTVKLRAQARSPAGSMLLDATADIGAGIWLEEDLAVAEDGSALLIGAASEDRPRTHLVRADGAQLITGVRQPLGVGPRGSWWLARATDREAILLGTADERLALRQAVAGPGWAAGLTEDNRLVIVDAQGKRHQPTAPFPLSGDARLIALGRCLVLHAGAASAPDPLGGPGANLWLVPWRAVQAQPAAPIGIALDGPLAIAGTEAGALWLWHDRRIEVVDCTGAAPASRVLIADAGAPVEWVDEQGHRVRVRMPGGKWLVADRQGRELWRGAAEDIDVRARDWLVVRGGSAATVVRLVDPGRGTTWTGPTGAEVMVDRYGRRALAVRDGRWSELDPLTGRERRAGGGDEAPPVALIDDAPGRLCLARARLCDKEIGDPLAPDRWQLSDAIRIGGALALLDQHGVVIAPRGAAWESVGAAPAAQRFGRFGRTLALLDADGVGLAQLANGTVQPLPAQSRGEDLPQIAPWRVWDTDYHAGKPLRWSDEAAGFLPLRLRGAESGPLLVVTETLLIELDQGLAQRCGRVIN